MHIKTKYVIGAVVVLICSMLYYFWYLGDSTAAYEDITDLSSEYNVDAEVAAAQQQLDEENVTAATVYTKDAGKTGLALTFDGLPDPTTTAQLVDLLKKYDVQATFFIEGSNCAVDKDAVLLLLDPHVTIGNYTYTGLTKLEKQPQDSVLEQLIKTQKVLNVLTGQYPELFKAPATSYVPDVLKTAAAAGLQSAVKTDVYVPKDSIKTDEDAIAFVQSVPQGSIVSFVVGTPTNAIVYTPGKTDERPAKDKQPNLKIREDTGAKHEPIVAVTERILKAMQEKHIQSLAVTDLRQIKRAETTAVSSPVPQPISWLHNAVKQALAVVCLPVSAAEQGAKQTASQLTPDVKAQMAVHNTAPATKQTAVTAPPRMIYTTEPAVAFAFSGLSKPHVVYKTLDFLKKNHAHGTFFVMDNELKANPKLVQDIIASGNEAAIGIRFLKNSNYETTRRQITTVQQGLAKLGVQTNLMMQPWGKITDDTYRAVADMKGVMYAPTLNIVNSKHQDYTSADAVMKKQFGKFVYSVGRGWILYFRLDYYHDDDLVVNVMDLIKRHKIDNIAYHSFYDDPKVNGNNDSAYAIESIGHILQHTELLYTIDTHKQYAQDGIAYVRPRNITFHDFMQKRYIGNKAVDNALMAGFTIEENRYRDLTGLIHTDKPVVFFTFDDFGTDAAINHLLYVFRKHHAKATFFVLTKNIMKNPNIIRTIAMEGHDVASHSEEHHPMDGTKYAKAYARYLVDYGMADAKLRDIVGDLYHSDGTPVYHPFFRPPTLTASRAGFKALYDTGYEYIVAGSYSTHDYEQPDLQHMIQAIKEGIFDKNGHVIKGAVLVMHMSDTSVYTATALDLLMTINDARADDDPAKFYPMPLSAYLCNGYNQADDTKKRLHRGVRTREHDLLEKHGESLLYQGMGY